MEEIITLLTSCQATIHNKVILTEGQLEKVKGTKLEQDLRASLAYFKAVLTRLSVCIDIMQGRAFLILQEEGTTDLMITRPDETTAVLIKKAEEMGARVTGFQDLVPGKQGKQQSLL